VQDLSNKTTEDVEAYILKRVKDAYAEKDNALGEVEVPKERPLTYTEAEMALPPEELAKVVIKKMAEALSMKEADIRADEILEQLKSGRLMSTVRYPVKERKMRLLERFLLLDIIDTKWKDHLQSMDSLREGIYLRGYAQKDPKLEYKKEGFALFEQMFVSMKDHGTDLILKMQVSEEVEKQEVENVYGDEEKQQASHADAGSAFQGAPTQVAAPRGGGSTEMEAQSEHGGEKIKPVETIRKTEREPGPNEPCPCGSGKKWKKCHGRVGGGGLDEIGPNRTTPRPREHKGEVKMGG